MIKKFITIILALMMCVGVFACDNSTAPTTPGTGGIPTGGEFTTTAKGTVDESKADGPSQHYQTGTLHQVNVTERDLPFVVDGQSTYKMIIPANEPAGSKLTTAASYLSKWIYEGTGKRFNPEPYNPDTHAWSEDATYIVIGVDELFDAAGLVETEEDLGLTGYQIDTAGKSVFLDVQHDDGYHRGILSILDHVLGFECYDKHTIVYEKDGSTLPEMHIVEKPDIELYMEGDPQTADERYAMGFDANIFINTEHETQHNTFIYFPKATYASAHPKWYSHDGTQLCYTAHGDAEEFEIMTTTMADRVLYYADKNTRLSNITITQEDIRTCCTCPACEENLDKYNGAASASILMFMNAVDIKLQAKLQARADATGTEKRVLNILFFAYHKSEKPPAVKNNNGTPEVLTDDYWEPIDSNVICRPNVGVYIAPIDARYNKSFYHEDNTSAAENIRGWAVCCEKTYFWLYETNYSYYLFPINTYDTMLETYRFLYENNAYENRTQACYENQDVTHFSTLKAYINSKGMFNVNVNQGELFDNFFKNYFGLAEKPMRAWFDELQAHLRYLEQQYTADVTGTIYNNMQQTKLWPKKTLDGYLAYAEEAYKLIEPLKKTDPDKYVIMYNKINLETIFPRYALLQLYPTTFTDAEFKEEAKALKADCSTHGIKAHRERALIESVFTGWGV